MQQESAMQSLKINNIDYNKKDRDKDATIFFNNAATSSKIFPSAP